jgi:hypothetical protein
LRNSELNIFALKAHYAQTSEIISRDGSERNYFVREEA